MEHKIKLSKNEFESFYEITGDTEAKPETAPSEIPDKQDTTPEFLTEEEEEYDVSMHGQEPQEDKLE